MNPDLAHLLDLGAQQMGITKAELLERDPVFDVDMPDWVWVIIRYDVPSDRD